MNYYYHLTPIFVLFFLPFTIFSETIIVPNDDYKIYQDKNISYIYAPQYKSIVPKIKEYQQNIISQYQNEFGFKFDDRLRVGLASNNNQIANGFSTQIPFNSQIFYGAGAGYIDYFCFDSWLKTLILHETAHNFQLNPKENRLSNISHKILGNLPYSFLGIVPIFPIPNITINGFLLEGNSVLNESRFGNGGRLYSGYALAELISMAKDNKIKPELMYNNTLNFPYGEKSYLIGGFFQQFLFKKYGIEKVNSYFKIKSKQLFPFFTNRAFKEVFGKSFENLLSEFVDEIKNRHKNYKATDEQIIAESQFFVPLNRNNKEIYTLIGDYRGYPKILIFNKFTKKVTFNEGAFRVGEPFKIDNRYYTLSSAKISPTEIKMGLLDRDAYMLEQTEGKVVQGFLPNGDMVYFDIDKSFEKPQIYINGKFYNSSSSSVFVSQNGDIYYFQQNGVKRTLYKNRKALFTYIGHYGFVTDIDKESIYFIALSKHGSTTYSYNRGRIERVVEGDDIIEFKKINKKEALVATISSDGYKYQIVKIKPKSSAIPKTEYIYDKNSSLIKDPILFEPTDKEIKSKDYLPLSKLEFSSLEHSMGYGDYEGFILNLKANFYDPAIQNSLAILFSTNRQRAVGGLSYENRAYQLEFGGKLFGVNHNNKYDSSGEDDYGYSANLRLPFLAKGYYRASVSLDYIKEYNSIYRKPLTLSLDISNKKQFGISKYPNSLNSLDIFILQDRDSNSYGLSYDWFYGVGNQSYIGVNGAYLKSDEVNSHIEKGIKIDNSWNSLEDEKGKIIMPTLNGAFYTNEAKSIEFGIYKTFDTSLYFFSSPISIQRENIYMKDKIYSINFLNRDTRYNEMIFGVESDFLLFNNFVLPIKFEYLYNKDVKDKNLFRILLGTEF